MEEKLSPASPVAPREAPHGDRGIQGTQGAQQQHGDGGVNDEVEKTQGTQGIRGAEKKERRRTRWIEDPGSKLHRAVFDVKPSSLLGKLLLTPLTILHSILLIPVYIYLVKTLWGQLPASSSTKGKKKGNEENGEKDDDKDALSVQKQASKTSKAVCRTRHILNLVGLCEDHLASLFLSPVERLIGRCVALRFSIDGTLPGSPLLPFGLFLARTEIGDDLIRRFVMDEGGRQVVVLGAGNDTRAYRLPCILDNKHKGSINNNNNSSSGNNSNNSNNNQDPKARPVRFFEIDALATQQAKVKVLTENGINIDHVTFVPIDFSTENFIDVLMRHGWRKDEPSVFLWEGVTYYLPEQAVVETFKGFSSAASGSYISVDIGPDFYSDEGIKRRSEYSGVETMIQHLKKIGEPLLWGLGDTSSLGVSCFLDQFGLKLVEHLGPTEQEHFFFRKVNGDYVVFRPGLMSLLIAKVP